MLRSCRTGVAIYYLVNNVLFYSSRKTMKIIQFRTLSRRSVCSALCALSIMILPMTSALAQDWRFEPILRAGGEFDDNATLDIRTDEEVELQGYLLDLRADVNYRSPRSTFFVQPRFLLRNYPDESDFDSDDLFLKSDYRYKGASNTLGFRVNFDRQSVRTAERTDADLEIDDPAEIPDNDTGRTLRFGDRDRWRISPFWNYRWSDTSSVGAQLEYIDARYNDVIADLLVDYTDTRINVDYRRSFSPVTTGVVTLTGRKYESGSGDSQNTTDGVGALVGVEHEISQNVNFRAMIGLEDTDQEGPDTDPEVVGNVTLIRKLETIRMLAQYRRLISASGASRVEVRDTVNFNFSRRLSEKISAGLGVRGYQTRGRGEAQLDSDRNYIQLRASFAWYLTTYFAIEADYRYTVLDRSGGELAESANSNRVNLWFVYQPNTVPEI
jgi:hypothetical protein